MNRDVRSIRLREMTLFMVRVVTVSVAYFSKVEKQHEVGRS